MNDVLIAHFSFLLTLLFFCWSAWRGQSLRGISLGLVETSQARLKAIGFLAFARSPAEGHCLLGVEWGTGLGLGGGEGHSGWGLVG